MRRSLLTTAIAGLAVSGVSRPALADVITYSISGITSGQIGATTFTNALVTVSLTGHTDGVVDFLGTFGNPGVTTVTIAGVGTAAVTDLTAIYASPVPNLIPGLGTSPFVFIGTLDSPPSLDDATGLAAILSGNLLGYDLKSAFSPLTASPAGAGRPPGVIVHTTLGNLTFNQDLSPMSTGTFQAVITSAPEPSSLAFMMTGGGAMLFGLRTRRGRRRATE